MPIRDNPSRINSSLKKLLSSVFVNLYAPTTSLGNAESINLSLPGLRGYWSMANTDENGDVVDDSGQGRKLRAN